MAKKILLASLGLFQGGKPYLENTYSLNDKIAKNSYFFLALNELLGIEFDRIILFLTEASRKAYESDIRSKIPENLEIIDISDGKTIEEIWKLFDGVVEKGMECSDTDVYLDITNGFRHLPLVLYNSLFYLECLDRIKISGIYYGALESNRNAHEVPVFDLTNLAKIIRGSFAVKQFKTTGNMAGVARFLNEIIGENAKDNPECPKRNLLKENIFAQLQMLIESGLAIESGMEAKKVCDTKFAKTGLKSSDILIQKVVEKLKTIEASKSGKDKNKIVLNNEELDRTLRFIQWQLDANNISNSLMILREWIVSRVMQTEGKTDKWLIHDTRTKEIENKLGFYDYQYKKKELADNLSEKFVLLIKNWSELCERRNEYAHAGYREKKVNLELGLKTAKEVLNYCITNKDNDDFWKLPKEEIKDTDSVALKDINNTALLTPMGASFGLLYTALKRVKADRVVVLTSEKFKGKVSEVCAKAGFDADKVKVFAMQDVFCGFGEAKQLSSDMISAVEGTCNCIVNLTGGTTAMQWTMQTVYEELKQKNMPVKRIAFVDRRPSVEQQSNPFVEGELIDVESLIKG